MPRATGLCLLGPKGKSGMLPFLTDTTLSALRGSGMTSWAVQTLGTARTVASAWGVKASREREGLAPPETECELGWRRVGGALTGPREGRPRPAPSREHEAFPWCSGSRACVRTRACPVSVTTLGTERHREGAPSGGPQAGARGRALGGAEDGEPGHQELPTPLHGQRGRAHGPGRPAEGR